MENNYSSLEDIVSGSSESDEEQLNYCFKNLENVRSPVIPIMKDGVKHDNLSPGADETVDIRHVNDTSIHQNSMSFPEEELRTSRLLTCYEHFKNSEETWFSAQGSKSFSSTKPEYKIAINRIIETLNNNDDDVNNDNDSSINNDTEELTKKTFKTTDCKNSHILDKNSKESEYQMHASGNFCMEAKHSSLLETEFNLKENENLELDEKYSEIAQLNNFFKMNTSISPNKCLDNESYPNAPRFNNVLHESYKSNSYIFPNGCKISNEGQLADSESVRYQMNKPQIFSEIEKITTTLNEKEVPTFNSFHSSESFPLTPEDHYFEMKNLNNLATIDRSVENYLTPDKMKNSVIDPSSTIQEQLQKYSLNLPEISPIVAYSETCTQVHNLDIPDQDSRTCSPSLLESFENNMHIKSHDGNLGSEILDEKYSTNDCNKDFNPQTDLKRKNLCSKTDVCVLNCNVSHGVEKAELPQDGKVDDILSQDFNGDLHSSSVNYCVTVKEKIKNSLIGGMELFDYVKNTVSNKYTNNLHSENCNEINKNGNVFQNPKDVAAFDLVGKNQPDLSYSTPDIFQTNLESWDTNNDIKSLAKKEKIFFKSGSSRCVKRFNIPWKTNLDLNDEVIKETSVQHKTSNAFQDDGRNSGEKLDALSLEMLKNQNVDDKYFSPNSEMSLSKDALLNKELASSSHVKALGKFSNEFHTRKIEMSEKKRIFFQGQTELKIRKKTQTVEENVDKDLVQICREESNMNEKSQSVMYNNDTNGNLFKNSIGGKAQSTEEKIQLSIVENKFQYKNPKDYCPDHSNTTSHPEEKLSVANNEQHTECIYKTMDCNTNKKVSTENNFSVYESDKSSREIEIISRKKFDNEMKERSLNEKELICDNEREKKPEQNLELDKIVDSTDETNNTENWIVMDDMKRKNLNEKLTANVHQNICEEDNTTVQRKRKNLDEEEIETYTNKNDQNNKISQRRSNYRNESSMRIEKCQYSNSEKSCTVMDNKPRIRKRQHQNDRQASDYKLVLHKEDSCMLRSSRYQNKNICQKYRQEEPVLDPTNSSTNVIEDNFNDPVPKKCRKVYKAHDDGISARKNPKTEKNMIYKLKNKKITFEEESIIERIINKFKNVEKIVINEEMKRIKNYRNVRHALSMLQKLQHVIEKIEALFGKQNIGRKSKLLKTINALKQQYDELNSKTSALIHNYSNNKNIKSIENLRNFPKDISDDEMEIIYSGSKRSACLSVNSPQSVETTQYKQNNKRFKNSKLEKKIEDWQNGFMVEGSKQESSNENRQNTISSPKPFDINCRKTVSEKRLQSKEIKENYPNCANIKCTTHYFDSEIIDGTETTNFYGKWKQRHMQKENKGDKDNEQIITFPNSLESTKINAVSNDKVNGYNFKEIVIATEHGHQLQEKQNDGYSGNVKFSSSRPSSYTEVQTTTQNSELKYTDINSIPETNIGNALSNTLKCEALSQIKTNEENIKIVNEENTLSKEINSIDFNRNSECLTMSPVEAECSLKIDHHKQQISFEDISHEENSCSTSLLENAVQNIDGVRASHAIFEKINPSVQRENHSYLQSQLNTISSKVKASYENISRNHPKNLDLSTIHEFDLKSNETALLKQAENYPPNFENKESCTSISVTGKICSRITKKNILANKKISSPELSDMVKVGLLKPDYRNLTVHTPQKLIFASIHETGHIIADTGKFYSRLIHWCMSIPNFFQSGEKASKIECYKRVYYQGRSLSYYKQAYQKLIDQSIENKICPAATTDGLTTLEGVELLPVALNLSKMKLLLIGNNEVETTITEIDQWADVDRW